MKIYAIEHSRSSWDDYIEWTYQAFIDKSKAEIFVKEYNTTLKEKQERQIKEMNEFIPSCPNDNCDNCDLDRCLDNYDFDYFLDEEHICRIQEIELIE